MKCVRNKMQEKKIQRLTVLATVLKMRSGQPCEIISLLWWTINLMVSQIFYHMMLGNSTNISRKTGALRDLKPINPDLGKHVIGVQSQREEWCLT